MQKSVAKSGGAPKSEKKNKKWGREKLIACKSKKGRWG